MLTVERATKLCSLGSTSDGYSYAATKLIANSQQLSGGGLDVLVALPHLVHVDVASNALSTLAGLELLPCLASLIASDNRLTDVLDFPAPAASRSLLRLADLRRNQITGAVRMADHDSTGRSRGLDAHTALETLLLDGNEIETLSGFAGLASLTTLSLSKTELTSDQTGNNDAVLPPSLTALDLSHCRRLIALPPALRKLERLRSLSLEGSPLDVDIGLGVCATAGVVVWGFDQVQPRVHQAYRWHVIRLLPRVLTLDGEPVTAAERAHAAAIEGGAPSVDDIAEETLARRRGLRTLAAAPLAPEAAEPRETCEVVGRPVGDTSADLSPRRTPATRDGAPPRAPRDRDTPHVVAGEGKARSFA